MRLFRSSTRDGGTGEVPRRDETMSGFASSRGAELRLIFAMGVILGCPACGASLRLEMEVTAGCYTVILRNVAKRPINVCWDALSLDLVSDHARVDLLGQEPIGCSGHWLPPIVLLPGQSRSVATRGLPEGRQRVWLQLRAEGYRGLPDCWRGSVTSRAINVAMTHETWLERIDHPCRPLTRSAEGRRNDPMEAATRRALGAQP